MNKENEFLPNVSIIIPTLNESKHLPLILSDLIELREAEILIIDSLSDDKTKDIAKIYGAKFYKLNKKNRGLQLNFGAKKAKGNWLLFLHADSRLKKNWSEEIKLITQKESNLIYFFNFKINDKKYIYKLLEKLVNLRCLLFKIPYGDQGLLIHKKTFLEQNGFKEIPLMEDIDFIKRLPDKRSLIPLKNSIFTSSRKWDEVNFITQSFRNWKFRRRWLKGDCLDTIYADYYKKKN